MLFFVDFRDHSFTFEFTLDFYIHTHGVIFLHIAAIVYYINTLDGLNSQMWEGQGWAL